MINKPKQPDLSIIIPARDEAENLAELLPEIREVVSTLNSDVEVIVIDEDPDEATRIIIQNNNSQLLSPETQGFGSAIRAGLEKAQSDFIITMDADLSHSPTFILDLWEKRMNAEIVIASRYIPDGRAVMSLYRLTLSKFLNLVFSRGLSLRVRDMSSGYRLYTRKVIKNLNLSSNDFDVQQEILVKALAEGYRVIEIPFSYQPRQYGSSNARVFRFGLTYLQTFTKLWKLRNSIECADYDTRAYDSWVIIQRYWQRQRYKYIIELSSSHEHIIDIGCGSSRILDALAPNSVGLDIKMSKLRYARRYQPNLIQGSALQLPVESQSFPCVICSQVIEHLSSRDVLSELDRILINGGTLILGTPDYGKWQWKLIEWFYGKLLPQAYADEHITHYTYDQLIQEFVRNRGYIVTATKYILQGELILALQKTN